MTNGEKTLGVRARRARHKDESRRRRARARETHRDAQHRAPHVGAGLDPGLPGGDELRVPRAHGTQARDRLRLRGRRCRVRPAAWAGEFDLCWIEEERSPFKLLGDRPFFSEVVFVHKPSRVLLVTDLWWNYPADAPAAWKFGMDRIYRPVYNGLMKQPGWEARIARIFAWDWDFLAPCHGEPVQGPDVKRILAEHLDAPVRSLPFVLTCVFPREGLAHAAAVDEEPLLKAAPSLRPVIHGRVEHNFQDLVLGLQALLQVLRDEPSMVVDVSSVVLRALCTQPPRNTSRVSSSRSHRMAPRGRVRTPGAHDPEVALPSQQVVEHRPDVPR